MLCRKAQQTSARANDAQHDPVRQTATFRSVIISRLSLPRVSNTNVTMTTVSNRILRFAAVVLLLSLFLLIFSWQSTASWPSKITGTLSTEPQIPRVDPGSDNRARQPRISCKGVRGALIDAGNNVDIPQASAELSSVAYTEPTFGSYKALNLSQGWMTFKQRYGPYGYSNASAAQSEVDWDSVDWGQLQSVCAESNRERFGHLDFFEPGPRFRNVGDTHLPEASREKTGRQAIVLRTWSTYEYHPEDLWNLRSIITEAALATNADYQVFLLIDLKCSDQPECKDVFSNYTQYNHVLESVPKEFRSISVLFDESLQRNWYPKTEEYRSMWQIMQPLQLFAHFYPEFDHYWQIEMDTRFTGHVGKMLQGFDKFGREQPYKQARERASWAYMSSIHGTYSEFSAKINQSLHGAATIWGPDTINNVTPFGPTLPLKPEDDDFQVGVGKDADLLLFGQLNDVRRFEKQEDWVFRDWYLGGFADNIPRYMSVPAQARASYDLLEAIHRSQHQSGLRVPSEATLPSWALWLGLKVVGLPLPLYQYPERQHHELNWVRNGGLPNRMPDGIANGAGNYRGSSLAFFTRPVTFDWWSSLADPVFEHWMGTYGDRSQDGDLEHPEYAVVPNELPTFMREFDGEVYMPELIVHPRKSNSYHAPG
ncbi:hypothetical protein CKM354_001094300 [Cercospora kikuchii]|uniref:Uncharacterized protein n=1 Tax=Cercospora kikuchii TaxID=84275 RepID=A0A9P3CZR9_9PEZI|nr:uncharacterized protein CKM354_001094300 [Cercospora kikuchii]GIZ47863.1 hypothetical protein CKM354_001094300 [Cercospora kikuchii]